MTRTLAAGLGFLALAALPATLLAGTEGGIHPFGTAAALRLLEPQIGADAAAFWAAAPRAIVAFLFSWMTVLPAFGATCGVRVARERTHRNQPVLAVALARSLALLAAFSLSAHVLLAARLHFAAPVAGDSLGWLARSLVASSLAVCPAVALGFLCGLARSPWRAYFLAYATLFVLSFAAFLLANFQLPIWIMPAFVHRHALSPHAGDIALALLAALAWLGAAYAALSWKPRAKLALGAGLRSRRTVTPATAGLDTNRRARDALPAIGPAELR